MSAEEQKVPFQAIEHDARIAPEMEYHAYEHGSDSFIQVVRTKKITEAEVLDAESFEPWDALALKLRLNGIELEREDTSFQVAVEHGNGQVSYYPEVRIKGHELKASGCQLDRRLDDSVCVIDVDEEDQAGVISLQPDDTLTLGVFAKVPKFPTGDEWLREEPPVCKRLGEYWDAVARYEEAGLPRQVQRRTGMGAAAVAGVRNFLDGFRL